MNGSYRPNHAYPADSQGTALRQSLNRAGITCSSSQALLNSLPFTIGDVTAGSENELQVVVIGNRQLVDLPQLIDNSSYVRNIRRRAAAGETSQRTAEKLENLLSENNDEVWENSWVRFPRSVLTPFANQILDRDFLADKSAPEAGYRNDCDRFIYYDHDAHEMLRIPVSYLLKLALADLVASQDSLPVALRETGIRLLEHFLNDNTSPETFSFSVVSIEPESGMGQSIAQEMALRFLVTQLLAQYANRVFGLQESGQRVMVYFAPHPPVRQKELNELVSDNFYRELFMSPCLSGWNKGEEKHRYMQLCHQVLSRSQLNAVAKLREAGIIMNNLVVLPNVSNISLANNGTHVSIGSRKLTALLKDPTSGFSAPDEKRLGDLTIKISEHFLPLFVSTYTAAPYRLDFSDFHPESALGFLAHELDYTHLRMFWRRWRKKADISIFRHSITPFGPQVIDKTLSRIFRLQGDFIPDYRLIDYLVCLLSSDQSPALDGTLGNLDRLRKDLSQMGVFDEQMSVYLLYKQREFYKMGFSGFEARFYSLFEQFGEDIGRATDVQTLITALAYKYMALGSVLPSSIPDTPSTESERRQIFFGTAVGLPTFFVHKDTRNSFLMKIVSKTDGVRPSKRYPGYLRIPNFSYRLALLQILREDAADLIDQMGLDETLRNLEARIRQPDTVSAAGRLTSGILEHGNSTDPMKLPAKEFNQLAESYYRTTLRKKQINEALSMLTTLQYRLASEAPQFDHQTRQALYPLLDVELSSEALQRFSHILTDVYPDAHDIQQLAQILLSAVLGLESQSSRQNHPTFDNRNAVCSINM